MDVDTNLGLTAEEKQVLKFLASSWDVFFKFR